MLNKTFMARQWNFNSVKWAFIEATSEASEIHYRNMHIKSYCFRSIQPILFSFTAWVRINVFYVARAHWGTIVNSQRMKQPPRDTSSVYSAYRQHHYHDNGVHVEFLTRHECTDITYAMHRLHLISPSEVFDRSIFFLPWRVDRNRKEKHARCATRRGSIDCKPQTLDRSEFFIHFKNIADYCIRWNGIHLSTFSDVRCIIIISTKIW